MSKVDEIEELLGAQIPYHEWRERIFALLEYVRATEELLDGGKDDPSGKPWIRFNAARANLGLK